MNAPQQTKSIIELLRKLQQEHGYLPEAELRALAKSSGVPLYRLNEVASFFPSFRRSPPPAVELLVCRDLTCRHVGSLTMLRQLAELHAGNGAVSVQGVSCLGRCDRAPVVSLNHHIYADRSTNEIELAVRATLEGLGGTAGVGGPSGVGGTSGVGGSLAGSRLHPDSDARYRVHTNTNWRIDPYPKDGEKFQALRQYLAQPDPERLIAQLRMAHLRGMGGAGMPAADKWDEVRRAVSPQKYVVANGDESEPGTFKDRELMLRKPYLLLEGIILAGLVTGATRGYIYVRHEYSEQIHLLKDWIRRARRDKLCGDNILGSGLSMHVKVFVSPGGYICGEQSALVEVLQDNRSEPRNRPPELATNGLFDCPTFVNNVETLAWVPAIALNGGEWYANLGVNGCKGRRFFSISGDVVRPGVYEVPIGIKLGDFLRHYAGGMLAGQPLRAFAPSGPSGGFLPRLIPRAALGAKARHLPPEAAGLDLYELPLDIDTFRQYDLMLGAGLVAFGNGFNAVDAALGGVEFFRNESCGKCVPCRLGSQKLAQMAGRLSRGEYTPAEWAATAELVRDLADAMAMTSICGLGQVAPAPLTSVIDYFPDDIAKAMPRLRPLPLVSGPGPGGGAATAAGPTNPPAAARSQESR